MKAGIRNAKIRVVRCKCGHIMRSHEWLDHWRSCKVANGREATEDEIKLLENYEKTKR